MPATSSLILEIERAIASGTVRQRLKALKYVTDMFLAGSGRYSGAQIAMFDDVLLRLAAVIELEARARLARRLAPVGDAPPKMIRALAFDDAIEVAEPVLVQSECLDEPSLVANASTKSQAHLYAISRRRTLSPAVTDVLVDRGDRRVVHSVAGNGGARFSENGFGKLVNHAGKDETLAETLGARGDLPRHHLLKLLQTASAAVREKLAAAHPRAAADIRTAVAKATRGISQEMRESSPEFVKAKKATKRRYSTKQLSETDVHSAARLQNFERTVAALAMLGRFPVDLVERALLDKSSDIVLILARAAGCSRATAKSLLLMSVADRGMSPHDVESALGSFDRLGVSTARRVVNYYVKRYEDGADADEFRAAAADSIAAVA
ncbi:MAG TPA: DUF2336 domain-containing protein [Xanthobacteraceae bacterium]|jgi:uncharacterized protein (DUF2336 family)